MDGHIGLWMDIDIGGPGWKVPSSDPRTTRNSQVWPGALARASLDLDNGWTHWIVDGY